MKVKLLFQGDSITDAGRSFEDPHLLGVGYPKYAAEYLAKAYPQIDFEFINLGIGGNQTKDLVARLQKDFIDIQPDIVSIMIGINDVWHHCELRDWIEDEVFENRYRTVLQALKDQTKAKIMIIEPYLIPDEGKQFFREDLYKKIEIIRALAREYADVYLATDGRLCEAFIGDDPFSFAPDGVHLSDKGADFVGKLYCEHMSKIIDKMLAENN
jgi:lysophospholipase L1-like esterase